MTEIDIRKYAELMKELELTGLEITEENNKVRLERSPVVPVSEVSFPVASGSQPVEKTLPSNNSADYVSVTSPFVGVFYAAPTETAEPYVSMGDNVKKGQILCIVESMKLMNEIVATEDGEILEVCVQNGQVVEYGTELFRIKR